MQIVAANVPAVVWRRFSQHTKEKLLVLTGPAALQRPGDKPWARAQQIARGEVKAQTIRLGLEASILLQWQSAADNVSHSGVPAVAKTTRPSFVPSWETSRAEKETMKVEGKAERRMTGSWSGSLGRWGGAMLRAGRMDPGSCTSYPPKDGTERARPA